MSDWQETTLGKLAEVQTGPFGSQLKNEQYITGGTPVVTVEHIKDFLIEDFVYPSITCEDKNRLSRYILKSGDIVFSRVGSVDLSALVKEHQDGWLFSSRMLRVRVKEKLDTNFLSYYLRQPSIRQFIFNISVGSTMPSINTEILKSLPIIYCSLEEQKKIADVLSCLDAKIDNLRLQNETLEAIARSLFKHWFIDFEFPTTDGKPYKSSGGAMIPSELGEIPESWRVGKLGDIGKNIREGVKENDIKPDMSYIGLEHIPRKQIALDTWGQALDIASNKFWFNKGNILFGKLRPYFHKVGVAFISGVCSTDILVIDSKQETYFGFLLMLLSSEQFIYYVSLASEGTRMPRTSWEYMKDYPIVIPKSLVLEDFKKLLKLLIKKMEVNIFQIQTLTKTRDALLPKLMSGQLRVKE